MSNCLPDGYLFWGAFCLYQIGDSIEFQEMKGECELGLQSLPVFCLCRYYAFGLYNVRK